MEKNKKKTLIFSLGGSLIVPNDVIRNNQRTAQRKY